MDITTAPGADSHTSDCPVQTCVAFFNGKDPSSKPTWARDWGSVSSERQRLYLLTASDGIVAIVVESVDGTTFDAITKTADTILGSVVFDKS